jgi:hypothetical protein
VPGWACEHQTHTRRTAIRTSGAFCLGAITGAVVVWFWGKEITGYVRKQTRGVRTKAVEGIRAVEEGTGKVLDRGGEALRHAEGILQDTKEHLSEMLQKGQEAIRPAPTISGA